jgi:hypothetical protein
MEGIRGAPFAYVASFSQLSRDDPGTSPSSSYL